MLNYIKLKMFGACKDDGKYFIECEIHGIQLAFEHGDNSIVCIKCMDELLESRKNNYPQSF